MKEKSAPRPALLFKVLNADFTAGNGGDFDYKPYLPTKDTPTGDGEPGAWTPPIYPRMCEAGYHLTKAPQKWGSEKDGDLLFVAEGRGHESSWDDDKIAFESIRLLYELVGGWRKPGAKWRVEEIIAATFRSADHPVLALMGPDEMGFYLDMVKPRFEWLRPLAAAKIPTIAVKTQHLAELMSAVKAQG